jgi:hypothetical protein
MDCISGTSKKSPAAQRVPRRRRQRNQRCLSSHILGDGDCRRLRTAADDSEQENAACNKAKIAWTILPNENSQYLPLTRRDGESRRHRRRPGPETSRGTRGSVNAQSTAPRIGHYAAMCTVGQSGRPGNRYRCDMPVVVPSRESRPTGPGIPMHVVVPSVSRATVLQGTALTTFVVPSGPTWSRPGPGYTSGTGAPNAVFGTSGP